MPEHTYKISLTKRIDVHSGNSLKTLARFTKTAGQARTATEQLNAETRESRATLKKSSRAFLESSKKLEEVGVSSMDAAEGMSALGKRAEQAGFPTRLRSARQRPERHSKESHGPARLFRDRQQGAG